ncbi:MAG: hypothetical protein HQ591_07315 [candidate division Zixibacteria bacterium]|nr:hypothetical protein [Candidatus Tariuqbacter arcticus]
MRCHCGSSKFAPLGVQELFDKKASKLGRKEIYLVNCQECGTTLSCSKHFYYVLKYFETAEQIEKNTDGLFKLAH